MPFLRDFYKNRYEPMPNSVSAEIDNVSREGWVADGKISFRKADGTAFVCTYEATSRDKSEEVKYRLNFHYFLWDCAAFGMICAAIGYVFFFETDFLWLIGLKFIGNLGLLTGLGIIGFFSWYFVMQGWRKYRYIFAIQQFKQYFADEQWVAIAEDVFPAPNDPYLLELRNQCVYHGIGLAIVPHEGMVRKLIDPSRLGVFGKDRRITEWVTRADWYQSFSQNVGTMAARRPKTPDGLTVLWNKIYRSVHYLLLDPFQKNIGQALRKPLGESSSAYNRFMSAQTVQKWVAFLAFLLIVPLYYKVATFSEERVADLKELQLRPNGINPEDQVGYLIEGETIPEDGEPTGVPKQFPIPKNKPLPEDENTIDLSGEETEVDEYGSDAETAPPPPKSPRQIDPGVKVSAACKVLQSQKGWIVQDNSFTDSDLAIARANKLLGRGLPAHWAALDCLSPGSNDWIVWLDEPYPTEAAAKQAAEEYATEIQRYNLGASKFRLRKLR